MIIDDIKKTNIKICLIGLVLVGIITRDVGFVIAFLMGCLANHINFLINEKFLDISGDSSAYRRNMSSYLLRMFIYVIALSLSFRFFGITAMMLTFVGALTIRLSILIIGTRRYD